MRKSECRTVVCAILAICGFSVPHALATPSAAELGHQLREALGFDARTLACLGVDAEAYGAIVGDAESFCDQNRGTVEPLIDNMTQARAAAIAAYEQDGDVATADQAVISAINALSAECGDVTGYMEAHLTAPQQTARDHVDVNRLLDPNLALLNLSSGARTTLRAAQQERDLVIKGHCSRKDLAACKEALATFEGVVESTLSGGEQSARAGFQSAQWNHWADAQALDEAAMAQ